MSYDVTILADSVSKAGARLTTMQITFPRFILAQLNTHRALSKSSASSRAVPAEKTAERLRTNMFVPDVFAANKRGMQGGEALDEAANAEAMERWRRIGLQMADEALAFGVHKQWANRLMELFTWHTVIVTATEWDNFFALRCNEAAQPEFTTIAVMMRDALLASKPSPKEHFEWHLPMVTVDDIEEVFGVKREAREALLHSDQTFGWSPSVRKIALWKRLAMISAGRCARVSYLNHDGTRDLAVDEALGDRLIRHGHMSPFEHAARPLYYHESVTSPFCGNFRGWKQLRKLIPGEAVFVPRPE